MVKEIKYEFKILNYKEIEESDINAQIMSQNDFNRLVENLKKDKCLTSTILVMRQHDSKKFRCISGHHRIRAAIKANIDDIPCLIIDEVDESTRTRLQLSHNDIHGEPDESILNILRQRLSENDIELVAEFDKQIEEQLNEEIEIEKINFQYVSICLMPESAEEFEQLLNEIDSEQKYLIEKPEYEQFKDILTIAFKNGYKTPGRAMRKIMDIINEHKNELYG